MNDTEIDQIAFAIFKNWDVLDKKVASSQQEYWNNQDPGIKKPWIDCAKSVVETLKGFSK